MYYTKRRTLEFVLPVTPPCTYVPVPGFERKFRSTVDGSVQECVIGMMYEPLICDCLQVSLIDPSCSDDLLLYFPYDVDFDDVTCHHAKGYAYGDGVASIVNDVDRGKVVRFDGNVRIEVPFMRNWFKDQCTTKFTVMLWFKRDPGNHGKVGLVHNGDCIDDATFLIYGNEGPSGKEVIGGLEVSPSAFTAAALVNDGVWHHVALTYDGAFMTLYVDNVMCGSRPLTGMA
ncbi:hypothetical protein LSAT2_013571 [Lamellibrachia satsuma]|nr:hypothetical protein LSAT2_013571 [Lamellibrachia satsuma]